MITLDYKNEKPLHEQIRLGLKELIISGSLAENEQLPSVRDMSVELTVNPNTVQRAYKDLEAEGFVYSVRGKGSFVSTLPETNNERTATLYTAVEAAVKELAFLGEPKEGILNTVNNIYLERKV